MSKIICDVCGTSYPETATQCPICGCVRPADAVMVNNEAGSNDAQSKGSYTYVKGGRFSKTNVKKRNSPGDAPRVETKRKSNEPQQQKGKGDKGLIIAICVLLVAIVSVVIYISVHFFGSGEKQDGIDKSETSVDTTVNSVVDDENPIEDTFGDETIILLPCEDILLTKTVFEFNKAGDTQTIIYSTEPSQCSDSVYFTSSDENVATVDEIGRIVAVGHGSADITIRCGDIEKTCSVVCSFGEQGTEPPVENTEPPVENTEPPVENTEPGADTDTDTDDVVLKLNYNFSYLDNGVEIGDITFTELGSTWVIYVDADNQISSKDVTFTSSNLSVITVSSRGVITVVGYGYAMITAEYQGQEVKCKVTVKEV